MSSPSSAVALTSKLGATVGAERCTCGRSCSRGRPDASQREQAPDPRIFTTIAPRAALLLAPTATVSPS